MGIQERRREELVLAAFNQIAERGFEGLRTREVAAEVGVNIATLHYYFPTKESLIRGVVDYAIGRFRSTLAPHGSPSDQLRNHLRAVRKLLADEPELGSVMGELALRSGRDKSIAAIMTEMYAAWHTTMRGLLHRAVKAGGLRPELDSDGVAAVVVATLTAMTLPTGVPRSEQAVRQLERFLGIGFKERVKKVKQVIDGGGRMRRMATSTEPAAHVPSFVEVLNPIA
jgi:AcrR family transcriptional regulator